MVIANAQEMRDFSQQNIVIGLGLKLLTTIFVKNTQQTLLHGQLN